MVRCGEMAWRQLAQFIPCYSLPLEASSSPSSHHPQEAVTAGGGCEGKRLKGTSDSGGSQLLNTSYVLLPLPWLGLRGGWKQPEKAMRAELEGAGAPGADSHMCP